MGVLLRQVIDQPGEVVVGGAVRVVAVEVEAASEGSGSSSPTGTATPSGR